MLFESYYLFDNFEHEAVGFFHLLQVGIFAGRVDVMLTGKYAYAAVKAFGGKHQGRGASTLVGKCDVFADFSSGGFYKSLCLRMQCVCLHSHIGCRRRLHQPLHWETCVQHRYRPRKHTVTQFTFRLVEVAHTGPHSDIRTIFVETSRMDVTLCALRIFRAALYRKIGYERGGSGSCIAKFLRFRITGMRLTTDKLHVKAAGSEIGFSHYVCLWAIKVEKNVRRERFCVDTIGSATDILVGAERE